MPIGAYRNEQVINADSMNQVLKSQEFQLVYAGSSILNSNPGPVNSVFTDTQVIILPFTLTGTRLDRVEFDVHRSASITVDLTVQIRRGMVTTQPGASDGTLIAERVIPWQWLPNPRLATYKLSVPFGIRSGLTTGEQLFVVINRVGSSISRFNFMTSATTSATYPTISKNDPIGIITPTTTYNTALSQAIYQIFAGDTGDLKNIIYDGRGITQIDYVSNNISKMYNYLPPIDTYVGGIRENTSFTYSGNVLIGGSL